MNTHTEGYGTEFADKVEQGIGNAVQGAGNWWRTNSVEQAGVLDDVLRATEGGIKNVGEWWTKNSADQEGIGDDILRGIGSVAGTGMRILDAGSYYGGRLGGGFATMIGVDSRIGGALGNVAGDLLAGGAVAKGFKSARAAQALGRMEPLTAGRIMGNQLSVGAAGGPRLSRGFIHDFGVAVRKGNNKLDEIIEAGQRLAPKYDGELPVYTFARKGDQGRLRKQLVEQIVNDPELAAGLYDGSINRKVLGSVIDENGRRRRIQGLHKLFEAEDMKTALNSKTITFVDAASSNADNLERAKRMRPPSNGSVTKVFNELYPDDPKLAAALEKQYRKQQLVGFNRVQQAAAEQGWSFKQIDEYYRTGRVPKRFEKTGLQYDAGHWRATMSEPHPLMNDRPAWVKDGDVEIWHAPTGDRTARIELRSTNQLAKADIKHDINPYAAKRIGVPRTWEEDIVMWVDREFHTGKYPDWYELGTDYMALAEDIAWDMPEEQVMRLFDKLDAKIKADPNHHNNWRIKEVIEDAENAKRLDALEELEFSPKQNWDELIMGDAETAFVKRQAGKTKKPK